jgi:hypothetical protein
MKKDMKKMMNEEESRLQHIKDAKKHLKELDTMKSNISGGKLNWDNIVEIKKKHLKSFLASLEE